MGSTTKPLNGPFFPLTDRAYAKDRSPNARRARDSNWQCALDRLRAGVYGYIEGVLGNAPAKILKDAQILNASPLRGSQMLPE